MHQELIFMLVIMIGVAAGIHIAIKRKRLVFGHPAGWFGVHWRSKSEMEGYHKAFAAGQQIRQTFGSKTP